MKPFQCVQSHFPKVLFLGTASVFLLKCNLLSYSISVLLIFHLACYVCVWLALVLLNFNFRYG